MLIPIGLVPTAFALNRTPDVNYLEAYKSASVQVEDGPLGKYTRPGLQVPDYRAEVSNAVKNKTWTDATIPAGRPSGPAGLHDPRLSSGVAGTMAANGSAPVVDSQKHADGLILTLPASIMIAFPLFVVLRQLL